MYVDERWRVCGCYRSSAMMAGDLRWRQSEKARGIVVQDVTLLRGAESFDWRALRIRSPALPSWAPNPSRCRGETSLGPRDSPSPSRESPPTARHRRQTTGRTGRVSPHSAPRSHSPRLPNAARPECRAMRERAEQPDGSSGRRIPHTDFHAPSCPIRGRHASSILAPSASRSCHAPNSLLRSRQFRRGLRARRPHRQSSRFAT